MPMTYEAHQRTKVAIITNDAGETAEGGDTEWQFIDAHDIARLPAELSDPLVSLNAALIELWSLLGLTVSNIALNVVTLNAFGMLRAYLTVPEFVRWVETGEGWLSEKPGFSVPIEWPNGWKVCMTATDGYTLANMAAPRFTLWLAHGVPARPLASMHLPHITLPLEGATDGSSTWGAGQSSSSSSFARMRETLCLQPVSTPC